MAGLTGPLTDWANKNIGNPKRVFVNPIEGLYNTFNNANTSNAGLVAPGMKGLERGTTQYTNKNVLPPKPTVVPMTNMPKPISNTATTKKGLGGSNGKSTPAVALPSLSTFPTVQVAPMTVPQDTTGTLAQTPESYKQAYAVTAGEFNDALAYNNSNSGGLGNYAQIPDGNGGTIGVDQSAYDSIQNPTIGSAGSSNWVDGLSNYETMQGAAGLGGLAMNAYGMFGSGGTMDVNKKNIELMNQQLDNNRTEMANRKGYRADIARTFGKGL